MKQLPNILSIRHLKDSIQILYKLTQYTGGLERARKVRFKNFVSNCGLQLSLTGVCLGVLLHLTCFLYVA